MATKGTGCGYPLEWFAGPVDDSFKCGICCQVLRDPTATKCGHVYCARCISSWVSYYGVCPERCREMEVDSLKRTLHLDKLISGLAVCCKNKSCRMQPNLAEKHMHEQSCPHRSTLKKLLKFSSQLDLRAEDSKFRVHHKRSRSSGGSASTTRINAIARRSPSAAALCRPSALDLSRAPGPCAMPVAMVSTYPPLS